jgi:hypothetical protein
MRTELRVRFGQPDYEAMLYYQGWREDLGRRRP